MGIQFYQRINSIADSYYNVNNENLFIWKSYHFDNILFKNAKLLNTKFPRSYILPMSSVDLNFEMRSFIQEGHIS